jgi:hypothetical protein
VYCPEALGNQALAGSGAGHGDGEVVHVGPVAERPARLDYAWFLAFSIDWDLKGMFSQLQPTGTGRPSRLFRP